MIVLSLVLVVAAAVSLLVGLFATESLALIFVAIGLCVASLALLFVGSRQRRQVPAAAGGPISYGAPPTSGGVVSARPVSSSDDDGDGGVLRKATARDAASQRVAAAGPVARVREEAEESPVEDVAATTSFAPLSDEASAETQAEAPAEAPAPKKVAKKAVKKSTATTATKATAKKSTAKKAAKTTAKKSSAKKSTAKKATKSAAKKATKKTTAKKATKKTTAKKAAKKTTGAAARAVLDAVSGVGAAKQDALLQQFGSLEAIRAASEDEISNVDGFGPALAKRVKNELS